MNHNHNHNHNHTHGLDHPADHPDPPPFWRSRYGIGLLVLGAIAAYFLLTEHRAHVLGALPLLILLACPLMHVFMHHGHGGHVHSHHGDQKSNADLSKPVESKPGDPS